MTEYTQDYIEGLLGRAERAAGSHSNVRATIDEMKDVIRELALTPENKPAPPEEPKTFEEDDTLVPVPDA